MIWHLNLVPALKIFPHEIYFEWLICILTMLLVPLFDKTPIKTPEAVRED